MQPLQSRRRSASPPGAPFREAQLPGIFQTQLHELEVKQLQMQHQIKLVKAQARMPANYSAKTVGRQHFGFAGDYLCTHLLASSIVACSGGSRRSSTRSQLRSSPRVGEARKILSCYFPWGVGGARRCHLEKGISENDGLSKIREEIDNGRGGWKKMGG